MSSSVTYLVTGANRGIGRGFVAALLQRASSTVIAAVRDPSKESSKALSQLPRASGSQLIVVKLDSAIESDAADAVERLRNEHKITSLDVVIANAGINHSLGRVLENSTEALLDHFYVNSIGPVNLLKATTEQLKSSRNGNPKFIAISTLIGTISGMELLSKFPAPVSPYGSSKAALNWLLRRVHFEEPWLTTFVFHPGLVMTDMAAEVVEGKDLDLKDIGAISVEESVTGMLKTIDSASRDIGGTFQNYDGTVLPW
ncbi:hypothetical protein PV10_06094 [Exophiala mesophila]|uniref:Aflatoxin biosynthesis ketoreductase nor-1 n=1 Tax=Exophiala mesophila TaxID=212818 RepID=A0A0D1XTU1_EXOME|nr:uncharacterized protein PV10_06094 [Exophiala mesophila]KIV91571.1 hypothetical protein PV10_06094 [Exophiala mesophila]